MDELKRFSQAILQGAGVQAPTSYIPEVSNYLTAEARQGPVEAAGRGLAGMSGEVATQEREAAEAARKRRIQEIQDQLDPGKYEKRRKADGGFDFFDPRGKQIDVHTYASRTGLRRVDILKDSENAIDQQYINDWSNANELAQAMYNGDNDTVRDFMEQNPDLRDRKPEEFMRELARKYPHMYGIGRYEDTVRQSQGSPAFRSNPNFLGGGSGGGFRL